MIKKFATAWEKNHKTLEQHFRTTPQEGYPDDPTLCALLFYIVINPYLEKRGEATYDVYNMRIIDDGGFKGCQVMVLNKDTDEPGIGDYVVTHSFYNSEEITRGVGMPTMEQVEYFMSVCKDIMYRATYIKGSIPKSVTKGE